VASNHFSYRDSAPPAKLGKKEFLRSIAEKHELQDALKIVEMPRDVLIKNGYAQVWNGYYRPSKELARMITIFERAWRWRAMRDSAAVLCKNLLEQMTGSSNVSDDSLPRIDGGTTKVTGRVISLGKVNRSGRRMVTLMTDDGWACRGSLPAKEFCVDSLVSIECCLKESRGKSSFYTFTKGIMKKW
jgi:hypothetical protein